MLTYILQAVSSVHVGDGSAVGAVDLPLARERHTGWPVLDGAGMKGALRARAGLFADDEARQDLIRWAFGPEDRHADPRKGALQLSPAVLLALPVRSLTAGLVLFASPLSLGRLSRAVSDAPPLPDPPRDRALVAPDSALWAPGPDGSGTLIIEELCWSSTQSEAVAAWVAWLRGYVGDEAPLQHLAVIHDDVFSHAVRWWTEVRTRAAIDRETHVVEEHKLFTTESAPPETLWWGQRALHAGPEEAARSASVEGLLPSRGESFCVGGHRSTGAGRVAWYGRLS